MSETFACLDCFADGPLTVHGACSRCGSQAVMPKAIYGNKANQRQEVGQGIRRQIAILDYRTKEKLRQARERKAAQAVGHDGSQAERAMGERPAIVYVDRSSTPDQKL